jgi:hypothetical protein
MATADSTGKECQADTKPADDKSRNKSSEQDLGASLPCEECAQRPVISLRHVPNLQSRLTGGGR